MKVKFLLKAILLTTITIFFTYTLVAQEVRIRPNDTTSNHTMIEPLNTNFGVFLGEGAGRKNTAFGNVFLGSFSGASHRTGLQNTFVGVNAGHKNTTANFNTIVGGYAGNANTIGHNNTFLGQAAGNKNITGYNNTFLGRNAGANNTAGFGNVFIGTDAGKNETSSNKLYIHNSSAGPSDALIYGDFASQLVKFNSHVGVNQVYTGTSLNVRSDENDFLVLGIEDKVGADLFTVQSAGAVYIKDSLGIGTFSPEAHTHIKSDGDARIILEADADNVDESDNPRIEFSQDGGLVKTYLGYDESSIGSNIFGISSAQKDKILMVQEFGHVGVNRVVGDVGLNVRSVPNDLYILNAEDENGTNRLTVRPDGHVGVNTVFPNVGLNVRSVANDVFILNAEDENGVDRLKVSPSGHVGVNSIIPNVGLNVQSVPNDVYILNAEDENGVARLMVSPDGNVGVNEIANNAGLNVQSVDNDLYIFNAQDEGENHRFQVRSDGHVGVNSSWANVGLNVQSIAGDVYILNAEDEVGTNRLMVTPQGQVGVNQYSIETALTIKPANGTDDILLGVTNTNNHVLKVDGQGHVGINRTIGLDNSVLTVKAKPLVSEVFTLLNTSSAPIFEIYPDGEGWMAGGLDENSDRTLKKNIVKINNATESVQQLAGYRYNWRSETRTQKRRIGVIAQEVQAVYPELVSENEEGILSVNYSGLSAVLIEAVKEQQTVLDAQKAKMTQQQNEIDLLKKQLESQASTFSELMAEVKEIKKIVGSTSASIEE